MRFPYSWVEDTSMNSLDKSPLKLSPLVYVRLDHYQVTVT